MGQELPLPNLWPANSLGARLGVEPRWLIEEADAGRIPGVRAGRTYLFDVEAVERELIHRARAAPAASNASVGRAHPRKEGDDSDA